MGSELHEHESDDKLVLSSSLGTSGSDSRIAGVDAAGKSTFQTLTLTLPHVFFVIRCDGIDLL